MTQEEKSLLFRDLCSRLPYGVVCEFKRSTLNVLYNNIYDDTLTINNIEYVLKDDSAVRPYLRPMLSMTKEEDKEYARVIVKSQDCSLENSESATTMANDWLLSKGFDVRGLISKGLALEAPEGMYK